MRKVLAIYGTRPEAIKMAPIVREIERVTAPGHHVSRSPASTARCSIRSTRCSASDPPTTSTSSAPGSRSRRSPQRPRRPGRGDPGGTRRTWSRRRATPRRRSSPRWRRSTSAFPSSHVEAGLRTSNPYSPFPEEINRRLTAQLASAAPRADAGSPREPLAENIPPETIVITGNTVIDALHRRGGPRRPVHGPAAPPAARRRVVLVTAHRRESWGAPMARSARRSPASPRVPGRLLRAPGAPQPGGARGAAAAAGRPCPTSSSSTRSRTTEFARLMGEHHRAHRQRWGAGGGTEPGQAGAGPPRHDRASRGIEAGTVRLVGTDEDRIVKEVAPAAHRQAEYQAMATAVNPYGDGQAARRSVRRSSTSSASASAPKSSSRTSASRRRGARARRGSAPMEPMT